MERGHQLLFSCLTITRARAQFSTPRAPESPRRVISMSQGPEEGPYIPSFQVEGHQPFFQQAMVGAAPSAV